jgi:biopolymer transport protein ExbD
MKIKQDILGEEARIELIPLIDVIFCILTFFILAALQLTRQPVIDVALPKAETGETQTQEMLIVRLDPMGQVYLYVQEQPLQVTLDELEEVLRRYHAENPLALMVLYANEDVKYNLVVQVLDRMRAVGGSRVALATLPSDGSSQQSIPIPSTTPPSNLQLPLPPTTNP